MIAAGGSVGGFTIMNDWSRDLSVPRCASASGRRRARTSPLVQVIFASDELRDLQLEMVGA